MTPDQFKRAADLNSLQEVDRVCHIAYFYLRTESVQEFTVANTSKWFLDWHFANPNRSRLEQRLRQSPKTIRGNRGFRLTSEFIDELDRRFPELIEKSQEVVDLGTVLPEIEYTKTRGYVETLAKQINASYEQNLFDGCAVLMRRVVEILLILSYQKLGIDSVIKDPAGNYHMLDGVISDAKNNTTLGLSRNGKKSIEVFRELGNFSAHKIEYTCRREYIEPHIQEFRALFTELLHKAGIRT